MLLDEPAKILLYKIERCGYYPRGDDKPSFGGISDTFKHLSAWTGDADLSLTKLLDGQDAGQLPVYMINMYSIGEDWFFACWNEVYSEDGKVTSISGSSKVGMPVLHLNKIEEGSIPGFATYFWVIPEKSAIATISFRGQSAGRAAMANYVREFLATQSPYVMTRPSSSPDIDEIIGYSDEVGMVKKAVPRFVTSPFVLQGRRNFVIDNHEKIIAVLRTGHVSLEKDVDLDFFSKTIRFLRGNETRARKAQGYREIRVSAEYTPTKQEVERMILEDDADESQGRWDRLGFEIIGEKTPIWIDRTRSREDTNLKVKYVEGGLFDLESIAKAIAAQREYLLPILTNG